MAGMKWNGWPEWSGITGRDHLEYSLIADHRNPERAFLNLIRKWLKAGILEEDGKVIYPVTGTPQGGVISAVLANIYLHYALDLWFEKVVKPRCKGDVMLMRFADDFVCCFQNREDERRECGDVETILQAKLQLDRIR